MARKTNLQKFNIEENTLRTQISRRGGGIEISLDKLGRNYEGVKMTAYQNYLGGGMLGSIGNSCNRIGWEDDKTLQEMGERLARYFHALTNDEVENYDEWAAADFESTQKRASSAY